MPENEKPNTSTPLPTYLLSKLSRGAELTADERVLANDYILAREQRIALRQELPHLHGWKWYPWAREFYESRSKINLLCAANQISKSSTQIRKCISWATDRGLWDTLWVTPPVQFWYLYPSRDVATAEFDTKWCQFLPRGKYKHDPVFGWEVKRDKEGVKWIKFNSGVFVYFKTYTQDTATLQTGTCDAIFCDEELPEEHYDELIFRISSSNGYFHMVFTATLGQEFWRRVMEPAPNEEPRLPEARKWCVSLYDCKIYEDGTPSHWTPERIKIVKNRCKNQNEVLRRVYGRFVYDGAGKKYEQFDIKRHLVAPAPVPASWIIYAGVDIGSGGEKGHPAAICFVAIAPDYQRAKVIHGWRGDKILTTAEDIFRKYNELVAEYKLLVTRRFYDQSSKDFDTIQERAGGGFEKADKGHATGENVVNALFKNDLLFIHDTPELNKLATELMSVRTDTAKEKAKDDFCDSLRYAITRAPWDWSVISGVEKPELPEYRAQKPETEQEAIARELNERRKAMDEQTEEENRIEQEFADYNDMAGA